MDSSTDQRWEVPILPTHLQEAINELGGTTPSFMVEKRLTAGETDPNVGTKLLTRRCQALEEFMTDEELEEATISLSTGLNVKMVASRDEQWELVFEKWVKHLKLYVFTKEWKMMVQQLGLVSRRDRVQLWYFRLPVERGSQLCFAINIKRTS